MRDFLERLICDAGNQAKEYYLRGVQFSTKSHPVDLLTETDTAVSEFLVNAIHRAYPEHHIKSEEMKDDINPGAAYEWLIDPIDGTRSFAHGLPYWGVIIAVVKDGEPYMAAVYFPMEDDLFFAEQGKGAYRNGKRIQVSQKQTLEHTRGLISRAVEGVGSYGVYFDRFRHVFANIAVDTDISIMNTAASCSYAYVASGSVDFAIGNSGLDWDRIGPLLICREAGAKVTDSDGNDWKRGRQDCVVANPTLHPHVMTLFT
ncbi:MAG TPA: inositol monophosphatase [Candidatus Kapabacteria bacterium]|nr:inositol monophosphatase [Candidatus Kapabacteria bacterium]